MSAVPAAGRSVLIDALRGALLPGILIMNMQAWVVGLKPFSTVLQAGASWLDHACWLLVSVLVSAKFYPIFAFLFGHGHAQQWRRLQRQGIDPRPVLTRRYLFLLGLGLAHGSLLFFGDILTTYALTGLVLLALLKTPVQWTRDAVALTLRQWLLLALTILAVVTFQSWSVLPRQSPSAYDFAGRMADFYATLWLQLPLFLPQILVFFLAGVWAERVGLLRHAGLHRRLWAQLARLGWRLGLPISLAFTLLKWLPAASGLREPWVEAVSGLLNSLCALLSLALVAAFVTWSRSIRPGSLADWLRTTLANAGRVALSFYLLQSLLMLVLLHGLGWERQLGMAGLTGLALAISALQLPLANVLLARWRRGPVEALWRRFSARRPA